MLPPWMEDLMNQFGYLGISLLIAIENLFPPIPSEVILVGSGFLTTQSEMNVWLVALFATVGSLVGAVALYMLGRFFNAHRLEKWINKWGKFLRIKHSDVVRAENWFNRRGNAAIFFCRFIPIVRSFISIPAGMTRTSFPKFLLFTAMGTSIWNVVLVYLGAVAGDHWESILGYFDIYTYIGIGLLAVVALVIFIILYKKWRARVADEKSTSAEKKNAAQD